MDSFHDAMLSISTCFWTKYTLRYIQMLSYIIKVNPKHHVATGATYVFLYFLQVRDEVFDREEKLFRGLEKAVRQLVKNVQCYLQHTQVATQHLQHNIAIPYDQMWCWWWWGNSFITLCQTF